MPKKKQLAYSRRTHDKRIYGTHVYNPHFLDIIAAKCVKDINEARKRVLITNSGKYQYEPSEEYKKFYKKHCSIKFQEYGRFNQGSQKREYQTKKRT